MQPHGRLHSDGTGATASRSNLRVEGDVDRDLSNKYWISVLVCLYTSNFPHQDKGSLTSIDVSQVPYTKVVAFVFIPSFLFSS